MAQSVLIDLTGKRIGSWTVLYRDESAGYPVRWICQCDCGTIRSVAGGSLRSGASKCCGCMRQSTAKDISNMVFGRLTAIKPLYNNKYQNVVWQCQCECGNIVEQTASELLGGHVKSCGCLQKDKMFDTNFQDLTGMRFGRLKVLELSHKDVHRYVWKCKCDCGNTVNVYRMNLKDGSTKSCGCLKSHGEQAIIEWLIEHHIRYEKEKRFEDCKRVRSLPFDFFLPDCFAHGACIEYDGIQHFQEARLFSESCDLETRKQNDEIKNEYCLSNKIELLRIPYWEKDNIDVILSEWLFTNSEQST